MNFLFFNLHKIWPSLVDVVSKSSRWVFAGGIWTHPLKSWLRQACLEAFLDSHWFDGNVSRCRWMEAWQESLKYFMWSMVVLSASAVSCLVGGSGKGEKVGGGV